MSRDNRNLEARYTDSSLLATTSRRRGTWLTPPRTVRIPDLKRFRAAGATQFDFISARVPHQRIADTSCLLPIKTQKSKHGAVEKSPTNHL